MFVEIGGQIVGANSLRCLLTAFHANDRQRDFPDQDLAQKFLDGEVTEIIAAHPLDRDRSEPVIPGEARGTLLAIRSGAVPGSLAKFTGMRRAASLLSAVLFYSSTFPFRADVSSRPYLLLRHRHIEQLSARKTCIAADTAVL